MVNINKIHKRKVKRATRVRSKVVGTSARPRISVFRSNKYFYVQAIDDLGNTTIAGSKSIMNPKKSDVEALGKDFAQVLIKKKVMSAVYDRGSYSYHGRVAAFADGLRQAGIKI